MSAIQLLKAITVTMQKDQLIKQNVNSVNYLESDEYNYPYIFLSIKEITNEPVFGCNIKKIIINCELKYKSHVIDDFSDLSDHLKDTLLNENFTLKNDVIMNRNYLKTFFSEKKDKKNINIQVAFYTRGTL